MDVILELGGNAARLYRVVELAKKYPTTKIVISSEGNPEYVFLFLRNAGIDFNRIIFDFNAWDTVTNFTKTKGYITYLQPKKLYIVTDKFHMERAMHIARAVYFLSGIEVIAEPYYGSEPHPPEPRNHVRNDLIRAWLWRLTGFLHYYINVKTTRMPGINADKQTAIDKGYIVIPSDLLLQ